MTAVRDDWVRMPVGDAVVIGGSTNRRQQLREAFLEAGWATVEMPSAASAATTLGNFGHHAALPIDEHLDAPLFDVVLQIRASSPAPLIVLLTHGTDPVAAEVALRLGADDVQKASIRADELLCRIEAILRRRPGTFVNAPLRFGDVTIDTAGRRIFRADAEIALAPSRLDILIELVTHPHHVLTFAELHRAGRHRTTPAMELRSAHTVTEHIRKIRLAVEPTPHRPRWIKTVRGVGYRFEPAPVEYA